MSEELELLEVNYPSSWKRCLAETTGPEQELVWQKLRGDQSGVLGVYERFEDNDTKKEYWVSSADSAEPDTPDELAEDNDEYAVQGWTYVADYTIHPLTPAADVFTYYIHFRIRSDYTLEMGCFDTPVTDYTMSETLTIAEITGKSQSNVWQKLNCNQTPILRIAEKEEAEAKLLKDGKLVISACPKYAGYLVNKSNAKYLHGIVNKGLRCYGHIWSYWYAIIDNVLYFVGLPLYTENTNGHIVTGLQTQSAMAIPVPPTEYDLYYSQCDGGTFREAMSLVSDVVLYGASSPVYDGEEEAGAPRILKKYGDKTTKTEICNKVLAMIDPETKTVEQYHRGDIVENYIAGHSNGGVFIKDGKFVIKSGYEVQGVPDQNDNKEGLYFSAYSTSEGKYINRAYTGFMPQKTKDVPDGQGRNFVYYFLIYANGQTITITAGGPAMNYVTPSFDDSYDFELPVGSDPYQPEPDPIDPLPPDPIDPWPPTPDPIDPDPIDPKPTPVNPSDIELDGGYIWVAGNGITITGNQDTSSWPYLQDAAVRVNYKIKVNKTVRRQGNFNYAATLNVSASGGGGYALPEEWGGGGASISYGVSGSSDISLTNASSYSGGSVTSSGNFTKNISVPWHGQATFGSTTKTNRQSTLNSNIVEATENGTETRTLTLTIGVKKVTVKVKFKRIVVSLKDSVVNEIIKNNTVNKVGSSITGRLNKSSLNGSVSGSVTSAPSLTASLSGSASRPSTGGVSNATGEISMTISNQRLDAGKATFSVSDATTGWYENSMDNRASASISGSFTVTTQARSL